MAAPDEALEIYQNAPHGVMKATNERTSTTGKQTRSTLSRPTYERPGAQAPRSSLYNYRNTSSSLSEFAFKSQQDQAAYSSQQAQRGLIRDFHATIKTTAEKEIDLNEHYGQNQAQSTTKNQSFFNDDVESRIKDNTLQSSHVQASVRRDDSIENERTQFISINNVNVINLQGNSAERKTNEYVIDNEPNQNIFDKMATANSGREPASSSPNQPSRPQNSTSLKYTKFAQDSLITNKKSFEMTSILPLRQHPTQKKVGQDLTLLRKEWQKFKAMLDG